MADAVSLVGKVNEVMTLLLAIKQGGDGTPGQDDKTNAQQLVKGIGELINALTAVRGLAASLGDASTKAAALAAIENVIVVDGGVSLATFFKQVGTAVIEAQQALDLTFQRDLDLARSSPPLDGLPPVQYAIPSVHAEMKVGFSQVSNRGINLLVFNNSQQKQNYSESTISFDIVAAPAPPNAARTAQVVTSPGASLDHGVGLESLPPSRPAPTDSGVEFESATVLANVTRGVRVGKIAKSGGEFEGGTDLISGIEFESAPITLRPFELPPTFPLRSPAKEWALAELNTRLTAPSRSHISSVAESVVVVPAISSTAEKQTLLYLCPGASKGARARRSFRCYMADVTSTGKLTFRAPRRPNTLGTSAALIDRGRGLIVPAPPLARGDQAIAPDVIGGVGSVLLHLIQSANAFQPDCILSPSSTNEIAWINGHLPEGVEALDGDEPWVVFVDRGERGPQHLEYIVMRAVYEQGTREWSEVHVVGLSQTRGRRPKTPHIHIPKLGASPGRKTKAAAASALVDVTANLEPLLRRLATIINAL